MHTRRPRPVGCWAFPKRSFSACHFGDSLLKAQRIWKNVLEEGSRFSSKIEAHFKKMAVTASRVSLLLPFRLFSVSISRSMTRSSKLYLTMKSQMSGSSSSWAANASRRLMFKSRCLRQVLPGKSVRPDGTYLSKHHLKRLFAVLQLQWKWSWSVPTHVTLQTSVGMQWIIMNPVEFLRGGNSKRSLVALSISLWRACRSSS